MVLKKELTVLYLDYQAVEVIVSQTKHDMNLRQSKAYLTVTQFFEEGHTHNKLVTPPNNATFYGSFSFNP